MVRDIVPVHSNLRLFKARVRIRGDRARAASLATPSLHLFSFFLLVTFKPSTKAGTVTRLKKPTAIFKILRSVPEQ